MDAAAAPQAAGAAALALLGLAGLLPPPRGALAAAAPGARRPARWPSASGRGVARRAADFEEGLSLEEMFRLAKERRQRAGAMEGHVPGAAAAAAAVGGDVRGQVLLGVLPCVFSPRPEPSKEPGQCLQCFFFEPRYKKMWEFAKAHTGGLVAVRYARPPYTKSPEVFALWPAASEGGRDVRGISLGLFGFEPETLHPFPLVKVMCTAQALLAPDGEAGPDPLELHLYLRSRGTRAAQADAVADMPAHHRFSLLRWLAGGGANEAGSGAADVPEP